MTDEARIERLTELARRVWPDAAAAVVDGVPSVHEMTDYYGEYLHIARHPRALDALEAALLVLAGETRRAHAQAFFAATPEAPAGMLAVADSEPPAWVEQLASEWEQSASVVSVDEYEVAGVETLRECAAELRERAKTD